MSLVSGNPKYNRGSQEDSHEVLMEMLNLLREELVNNEEGTSIMNKFWGKEAYTRKFKHHRFVFVF